MSACMNRGDRVRVVVYGGDTVWRRIWAVTDFGAAICTDDRYEEAVRIGEEPLTVGFRREYIVEVER